MDRKIITVKGHLLGGKLYCNIGLVRPRNVDKFQNNLKGFFRISTDLKYIIDHPTFNKTLQD